MADIEKVKQGLRCCDTTNCNGCPFKNEKDETYPLFCRHVLNRDATSVIEELQAEIARLQPKNGKWIEIESQTGVGAFGFNEVTVNALRCSECRKKIDVSDGNFKYCPYCGAIMNGGDGCV